MIEAKLRDQSRGVVRATFQDAIDKYITDVCPVHKSGTNITKRLKALAKTPDLLPVLRQIQEVTAADFARFRDKRLAAVSVATVRKEMAILRSVLESARRDWGMIQVNPIVDVKKPPAPPDRKRLMLDSERDLILNALAYTDKVETLQHQVAVAMLLALETAMRAGEMLGLNTCTPPLLRARFDHRDTSSLHPKSSTKLWIRLCCICAGRGRCGQALWIPGTKVF